MAVAGRRRRKRGRVRRRVVREFGGRAGSGMNERYAMGMSRERLIRTCARRGRSVKVSINRYRRIAKGASARISSARRVRMVDCYDRSRGCGGPEDGKRKVA